MDATLNWKGRMSFEGAGNSGFVQKMDTSEVVGGDNGAASPMEFIALGLAGCAGMDVISILLKKRQAVTDFQVKVHASRAKEHPKVFTEAIIEFMVCGTNIDEVAVLRAIELSMETYCPVHAMLSKAFPIRFKYNIFDEDTITLLKEGEYIQT